MFIGGVLAGFALMGISGLAANYIGTVGMAGFVLPLIVFGLTLKRWAPFAIGVLFSFPLAVLGAFVACFVGMAHYNR